MGGLGGMLGGVVLLGGYCLGVGLLVVCFCGGGVLRVWVGDFLLLFG